MESTGKAFASDAEAVPSPRDAVDLLRRHGELHDRAASHGPSREFEFLMLWNAVAVSAYISVYLLSFGGRVVEVMGIPSGGYGLTTLLLVPMLSFSSLVSGARERFSVRRGRPDTRWWVAMGLVLATFMALTAVTSIGARYPWWMNLVLSVALFILMAAGPVRRIRNAMPAREEPWENRPLSQPAKVMTMAVGAAIGLLAATIQQPWFAIVSMAVMVLLLVGLVGSQSPWGLPRTGFEWGPIHWASFGVAVTTAFLLAALLSLSHWATTPLSVGAGALIFVVMLVAAFLPPRLQRG